MKRVEAVCLSKRYALQRNLYRFKVMGWAGTIDMGQAYMRMILIRRLGMDRLRKHCVSFKLKAQVLRAFAHRMKLLDWSSKLISYIYLFKFAYLFFRRGYVVRSCIMLNQLFIQYFQYILIKKLIKD